MLEISDLPTVNATLNATSLKLLSLGFRFIKKENRRAHKVCMIAAVITSALFLISYLTYHASVPMTRFTGVGLIRSFYFFILVTHVLLAAAIVPLVIVTLVRAIKGSKSDDFSRHKKIAKWTWPIWMYVSVTGIMVYIMLYRL